MRSPVDEKPAWFDMTWDPKRGEKLALWSQGRLRWGFCDSDYPDERLLTAVYVRWVDGSSDETVAVSGEYCPWYMHDFFTQVQEGRKK